MFESEATDLVPGDTNGFLDVFVHDRTAGTTRLVSVSSTGTQGNGVSGTANDSPGVVSRDGRYVAFTSDASNLVPGDTNGKLDVFVRDLKAGTTVRASVGARGRQGDGNNFVRAISATGRFVLFVSRARTLVPHAGTRQFNLFVRDLTTSTTTLEEGPDSVGDAAITPDGRFLVFSSSAPGLVPNHPAEPHDVYLRDRHLGTTTLVSHAPDGGLANGDSSGPFISDDGAVVAFISVATNLAPGGTPGGTGAFVRDLRAGTTTPVAAPGGSAPNGPTFVQGISADGRRLLLELFATNLVPGDTNDEPDLFLYDRRTRAAARVNVGTAGQQADGPTFSGALSADGRVVAFTSESSNLVRGGVAGREEVLVRAPSGAVAGSGEAVSTRRRPAGAPGPSPGSGSRTGGPSRSGRARGARSARGRPRDRRRPYVRGPKPEP